MSNYWNLLIACRVCQPPVRVAVCALSTVSRVLVVDPLTDYPEPETDPHLGRGSQETVSCI